MRCLTLLPKRSEETSWSGEWARLLRDPPGLGSGCRSHRIPGKRLTSEALLPARKWA